VESVFFCEGLPDARGLDAFARESRNAGREGGRRLRAFLPLLGRAVGTLHRLGFSHRDLKAGNLLASGRGTPAPFLADLEGLRYLRVVPARRREKDLARFLRSAREDCGLSRTDWVRVLAAYACAAGEPVGSLRALASAVDLRARAARGGGGA
jgi:tRNA A-37 threonylcarbamoyl transferase component Bud32